MAYYIEPVDRDLLPDGRDWMFIEEPGGDCRFVLARDADSIELPTHALLQLMRMAVALIATHDIDVSDIIYA